MRGVVLAMAIAAASASAAAQTDSASGTLVDEAPLPTANAESATATSSTQVAQQPSDVSTTDSASASVAAAGLNVSESADTAAHSEISSSASTIVGAHAANSGGTTHSGPEHADVGPAATPRTPTSHSAPAASARLHGITPANELERKFVAAAEQSNERPAFRELFLRSQVALATVANDATAAPRQIQLGPGGAACLIFTSNARATEVMGAQAPRVMMTGREALERLRGAPLVIININLEPYLTLDADGVEGFLAVPVSATAPHEPPPASAGPSQ